MSASTQGVYILIFFMVTPDAAPFTARSPVCNMACKPNERPSCLTKSPNSAFSMKCCPKQWRCLYCWSSSCPNFESLTCSNSRGICKCFCTSLSSLQRCRYLSPRTDEAHRASQVSSHCTWPVPPIYFQCPVKAQEKKDSSFSEGAASCHQPPPPNRAVDGAQFAMRCSQCRPGAALRIKEVHSQF
ncbi:uncharacterized protein LOC119169392 isoform X1 [Rhipicephalus microplus]|uniref:uncharacterized protein LOC119169392 isoform X1 n=1 Tax=Rhipicephalus microplus TaxID=6941 RepID=UPI003F6D2974